MSAVSAVVETLIIAIGGSIAAISLGGLWFAKWIVDREQKAEEAAEAAELKAMKEIEKAKLDAEEKRRKEEREADPAYQAAKEKEAKAAEEKRAKDKQEKYERAKKATMEAQAFIPFPKIVCQKCGWSGFYIATPATYCECDAVLCGHYHCVCNCAIIGCKARWIMLAKGAKIPD